MISKYKTKYRLILLLTLILSVFLVIFFYIDYVKKHIPQKIYINEYSDGVIDFDLPFIGTANYINSSGKTMESSINLSGPLKINSGGIATCNISVKFLGLFDVKDIVLEVKSHESVVVGGIPVGIYIETEGIMVVGIGDVIKSNGEIHSPARGSLIAGDYILSINDIKVTDKDTLIKTVEKNNGEYIKLQIKRNDEIKTVKIKPEKDATGKYKLGIWIKDDCQGLGTLTYIDSNGVFGTLGHAISDPETGGIIDIETGKLYTAKIWSVIKGKEGNPGEVIGSINYDSKYNIGTIDDNMNIGIYGNVNKQMFAYLDKVYMEVAYKQDVEKNTAYIRSFVGDDIKDYEIRIDNLNYADLSKNKGIEFTVVDKDLLGITNGIIQGMSGSPIIQDGKIIGAVTHVLVNDPTRGYGIFIENMLEH